MSAVLSAQQAAAPVAVPIDQEPMHHLYLANNTVRVFKVEVPAGARTLLHQHDRDYMFVTLGDSDVINARQGEPARELKLKDGDVGYTPGGFAHVAINKAGTAFRNVTVEIVKTAPDPKAEQSVALAGAGMSVTFMVENPRAHAELDELEPGATTPLHEHKRDHLAIALNNFMLENDVVGKGKSITLRAAGDVAWVPGGYTHTFKNLGKTTARWVVIEIK
jgi:oxalate decarboxylase/phosphoglucose isomerase-like protein (cupin superfamily)